MSNPYAEQTEYEEYEDNVEQEHDEIVSKSEFKELTTQLTQFTSMMVSQKEEADQRMNRIEHAFTLMDKYKELRTPRPVVPVVQKSTIPPSAQRFQMPLDAETVMKRKQIPARRESFYEKQVKQLEKVTPVVDQQSIRLVQVSKEDDSYRMEHITIPALEVFEDRMLQLQDEMSMTNVRYAKYLSKDVSRRVVRYLREQYKVDEENALTAGRLSLSNQQIMDYLSEMATPKSEEETISQLRSVHFPRVTKAVTVQQFIPFYEALEVFNGKFKRRLKFLELHCPQYIPATTLGNECHPGLIGIYLELIPSEVGMKVHRSLGTESVRVIRQIRVFIDLYFNKCTEMADVSKKSRSMNKTLGVPEERDYDRAVTTPVTRATLQTPKLKSIVTAEDRGYAPKTKTEVEVDQPMSKKMQPWDDYWVDDSLWYDDIGTVTPRSRDDYPEDVDEAKEDNIAIVTVEPESEPVTLEAVEEATEPSVKSPEGCINMLYYDVCKKAMTCLPV